MKLLIWIPTIVAIASAGVAPFVIIPSNPALVRSPQHDSAIVQSERLGGNFAYAIAEGQAFRTVSPFLSGSAGNIRAINSLGISYAINPINIPIYQTAPATILLQQKTTEEKQREQQKQIDFLQKQRDQLQQESDRLREVEERQLLALQEQQENSFQDQLQDQINQQILWTAHLQEQQKQLLVLQQEQQNLIGSASIIASVPALGPTMIDSSSDSNRPSTTITDDAVIIENTSLNKSMSDAVEQSAGTQNDDGSNGDNKSA